MKLGGDGFVLSTGRTFCANRLILGLAPDGDVLYEGYDGVVDASRPREEWEDDPLEPPFTPAERREIAEYMIERWRAWGAKGGG